MNPHYLWLWPILGFIQALIIARVANIKSDDNPVGMVFLFTFGAPIVSFVIALAGIYQTIHWLATGEFAE